MRHIHTHTHMYIYSQLVYYAMYYVHIYHLRDLSTNFEAKTSLLTREYFQLAGQKKRYKPDNLDISN